MHSAWVFLFVALVASPQMAFATAKWMEVSQQPQLESQTILTVEISRLDKRTLKMVYNSTRVSIRSRTISETRFLEDCELVKHLEAKRDRSKKNRLFTDAQIQDFMAKVDADTTERADRQISSSALSIFFDHGSAK